MKQGNFTENEVEIAKKGMLDAIQTIDDEQDTEIMYFFGQEFCENKLNIEQYKNRIAQVTKDDVLKIAQNIEIDTIYFLKNQ